MFFTRKNSVVWDPDLDQLEEILAAIDVQFQKILSVPPDTADMLGYYERGEYIAGLGFVACQAYMAATYGYLKISKHTALSYGPQHRTGLAIIKIVNHAANFWKHHDEWPLNKNSANQNRIRDAFKTIGISIEQDYPLSCVLAELVTSEPMAFISLIVPLKQWRDQLRSVKRLSAI